MIEYKMTLTDEEKEILEGKQGETKQKMMETLVLFGDIFNAKRMVKVTHKQGHLVTSFGIPLLKPLYGTMEELINDNCKAEGGFTMDPRPLDYKNVKCNILEKIVFNKILYGKQKEYEEQLKKVGLTDEDSFSCTSYLKECGNRPSKGDILSWAESSAVVFANSVLGARCNRNSGVLELFGTLLGYAPEFGFWTDEGRKATWKVIVKCTKRPEAQILGSAIGMKVMEDVPYVIGLDKYLKKLPDEDTIAYLKDFGAATASNGAVGLYHIEGVTPEAVEQGQALLKEGAKEYVIDDAEIERVKASYPIMWKKKDKKAYRCFIGCPHLTIKQLNDWTDALTKALQESGKKKLVIDTVFTTSPAVAAEFEKSPKYQEFLKTGAHLSSICPLMYVDNPLTHRHRIMTTSNKLRTYSESRYYTDEEALSIISGKEGK